MPWYTERIEVVPWQTFTLGWDAETIRKFCAQMAFSSLSNTGKYLGKPRATQEQKARWESKLKTQWKGHPVRGPPRAVPGELPSPFSMHENHQDESMKQHLLDWGGLLPRGMGNSVGGKRRTLWDCTRLIVCLWMETKIGKGRDLRD